MMRTGFLMFLLIAFAVSCQQETVESKSDSGIEFFTLLTRGDRMDSPADVAAAGGFQVWGYRHSGNWPATINRVIFDGTHVTSSDGGTTWSYSGVWAIWPKNDKVSFFACAPAGVEGAVIDDQSQAVPAIGFTVNGDPAAQKDLLIAQQMLNHVGPDPVEVVLDHALSRISFSARKTPETTGNINVTKIELRDISYMGSAPMLTPISWTVDPAVTQYTLTTANGLLTDTSPSIPNDSWQTIITTDGTMLLMPQTLASTAVMAVTFSYSSDVIDTEFTSLINLSEVWPTWEARTPYNYQLLFDGTEIVVIGSTVEPVGNGNWGQY